MADRDPLAGISDLELLARTLTAEAGGEGEPGMLAAGAVIRNRRDTGRWGPGWRDVILAPGQFSAFNAYTGYAGGAGGNDLWTRPAPEAARRVAARIMAGDYDDPTGGALHFYAPASVERTPSWAEGRPYIDIGRHRFLPQRNAVSSRSAARGAPKKMLDPRMRSAAVAMSEPRTAATIAAADDTLPLKDRMAAILMAAGGAAQGLSRGTGIDPTYGYRLVSGMRQQRREQQGRNITAEYLAQRSPELAQMVATGQLSAKDALQMLLEAQKGGGLDKDRLTAANAIRDDVRADLATISLVQDGARTIQTLFSNPGAVSDYALAVAFAKIVDPGSVAREGEVAAVQRAGAMFPQYLQTLKNAFTGEGGMNPAMRLEIAQLAAKLANEQIAGGQRKLQHWRQVTAQMGIPFEWVWTGGELTPMQVPTAPASGAPSRSRDDVLRPRGDGLDGVRQSLAPGWQVEEVR